MANNEAHDKPEKQFETELNKEDFRVAIFGSARVQKNDAWYQQIYNLAFEIGLEKWDIVTGGGPGMMDAANTGHQDANPDHTSESIGLTIELPWEAEANKHLDMKKHFKHFSSRLDHFMVLSNIAVVVPGGIGTCLELFYTWQLVQVKHICPIPIILLGEQWHKLIDWVKEWPLEKGLVSPEDLNNIYCVKDNKEAMKIIKSAQKLFLKGGDEYCSNLEQYRLDEE